MECNVRSGESVSLTGWPVMIPSDSLNLSDLPLNAVTYLALNRTSKVTVSPAVVAPCNIDIPDESDENDASIDTFEPRYDVSFIHHLYVI